MTTSSATKKILAPNEVEDSDGDWQAFQAAPCDQTSGPGLDVLFPSITRNAEQAASNADHAVQLEEHEKHTISVYFRGQKNVVTWYADAMSGRDIQEAILCACDAIMDGGFVLREIKSAATEQNVAQPPKDEPSTIDDLFNVSSTPSASSSGPPAEKKEVANEEFELGETFEFEVFHRLRHGGLYLLQPAGERKDLEKITGDRWRRLKVMIDPLLHVEAKKAVERMKRGANLLKHTRYGFPHLRHFQLSEDTQRLLWYSAAKSKDDTVIWMDQVSEISLGQGSSNFKSYRLPMLEHLSLSIVTKNGKTVDITCKDEFEFDHWVTGLKALHYHHTSRELSKEQLLSHSQRFKRALAKNNVSIKLTQLPEVKEKGHIGLDDCIEIQSHSLAEIEGKIDRLKERHRVLQLSVAKLDFHAEAEMELDVAVLVGQGPAYAAVFQDMEGADDEEMELKRMNDLLKEVQSSLTRARNDFIAIQNSAKSNEEIGDKQRCRELDQLLWKCEVDVENVEDILSRYLDTGKGTQHPWAVHLQEGSAQVQRSLEEGWQVVNEKYDELRKWWAK
ncbi:unnamed protein product [Amoebophrya sp. A25]|nr:unnamed protein product [Amoebophrya sp. A25]|eukprot:GSA25T00006303001.1